VIASACRGLDVPIFAVFGNHDHHAQRTAELAEVLGDAGVRVLDRQCASCEVDGLELGVVGTKGFVGGFPGSALPDFGEPLLRSVYAETSAEAEALARGLQEIVHCDVRIVLLHYAPVVDTLEGEPPGIHTYLGSERLATPIAENGADLVLHGHAHAGSFEGPHRRDPRLQRRRPREGPELLDLRARRQRCPPGRRGRGRARASGIASLSAWKVASPGSRSRP